LKLGTFTETLKLGDASQVVASGDGEVLSMMKRMLPILMFVALLPFAASAADNPVLVFHAFTMASGTTWPYDLKQMQTEAVGELQAKFGKKFDIVAEVPSQPHGKIYTLDGEVTGWRPGNRLERNTVG